MKIQIIYFNFPKQKLFKWINHCKYLLKKLFLPSIRFINDKYNTFAQNLSQYINLFLFQFLSNGTLNKIPIRKYINKSLGLDGRFSSL